MSLLTRAGSTCAVSRVVPVYLEDVRVGTFDIIKPHWSEHLRGKIDTAATRSAIPLTVCEKLKIEPVRLDKIVFGEGKEVERPVYFVNIDVPPFGYRPLEVWGLDRPRNDIALGWDVLCEFKMFFALNSASRNWFLANVISEALLIDGSDKASVEFPAWQYQVTI